MKKFILNKEAFNSNPAYNTWTIVVYDSPDDKSVGVYCFLKHLDIEIPIFDNVECPEEWFYVQIGQVKGYLKQNNQIILVPELDNM